MKMTFLIGQPSPDNSNHASTSGQSRDDQETGSNEISNSGDVLMRNQGLCHFPYEMDLNPARVFLAELVGTFILMFCVCGIIAVTQLMKGEVGLLEYAATAGLTVIVVIFSIGPISGAHLNPAVTIAFATFGHFPWSRLPFYILAQTVGSVVATWVGSCVYGIRLELMLTIPLQGCISAFWVEFIATFIVVFLAVSMAYEAQSVGNVSGFVVGISIGLAVLITGPVSGGSLNPARSLGPAIVTWKFKDIWIYITAPTLGAVAGALLYRFLRIRHQPSSSNSSPNNNLLGHCIPIA
ncbi:MIP domain-containing protein [Cephalotus follicularis]|uniref:MIP domain-containing protein n=1 Tax=Cephalotus follicularis TaxID=3775 RepID=A0A1Q3AZE6_CEPFO|nr:MIP domain-containing protein [Cephalotus follicularis]